MLCYSDTGAGYLTVLCEALRLLANGPLSSLLTPLLSPQQGEKEEEVGV